MGSVSTRPDGCLDSGSKFERWNGLVPFQSTCFLNTMILNSLYSGLVVWITAASSTSMNDAIAKRLRHNMNAQRAATWAATFAVAFATSFLSYAVMHGIFGYGNASTNASFSAEDAALLEELRDERRTEVSQSQ